MFPNMSSIFPNNLDLQQSPNQHHTHHGSLHLFHNHNHPTNQNHNNNHHGSLSTRQPPNSTSSPTSSQSPTTHDHPNSPTFSSSTHQHNINSSTSFKFNLLNTVRKAFKKNGDQKESNNGSQTNLTKVGQSGRGGSITATSANTQITAYNSHYDSISSQTALKGQGRLRSSTFDSGSSEGANSPILFKQQMKQQENRQEQMQKITGRKLFKSEKVGNNRIRKSL
jgi:hypothetical protein